MNQLLHTLTPLYPVKPSWERVYKDIAESEESSERKEAWKKAIDFLFGEFGRGFFDTCGHNHPVKIKLTTNLFFIDDLLSFTAAMSTLKQNDAGSYAILLEKLKPRMKCRFEGIPFSDVLRMFSKVGFDVEFLREVHGRKNPDIRLRDQLTAESIFVEVSQLLQSADQKSIQEQHRILSDTFLFYGFDLPKACKQLQPLQGKEMDRIIAQIKMIKDKAVTQQAFVSFEDDFIAMAVSHPSRLHELDEWCDKKEIRRNSMDGLPLDYNDTKRLVGNSKIESEIKQLPAEDPGFVYIPVSYPYFLTMNVPDTAIGIMDQLVNFPNCLGVALYANSIESLLQVGVIEVHGIKRTVKIENGITHHLLFIGNPCFDRPLSPQTKANFQNAFL